jgi:hypothetical protein
VPRPDFVFGIEDLELANLNQAEAVIDAFRHAVAAELATRQCSMNADRFDKFKARVKDCCSFHLFVPLAEAYFFADQGALEATGCTREAQLEAGCDVELFRTIDLEFLNAPQQPPPHWAIDPQTRALHPKRYLQFLLDPEFYSETEQGVAALQAISWQTVLGRPDHTLFLRSLFQDLAFALGLEISLFPGNIHGLTSDYQNRNRVLRNF